MDTETMARVRTEIESLHEFFVGWFTGALPKSAFDAGFLQRIDAEFILVPPAGQLLTREQLADAIHGAYASNPNFRIAIRNVCVRRELKGYVLATYEEWQRNAMVSRPAENARLATVLFRCTPVLQWMHVHETWMADAVVAAGSFDF